MRWLERVYKRHPMAVTLLATFGFIFVGIPLLGVLTVLLIELIHLFI
jgi:hypothetical protein